MEAKYWIIGLIFALGAVLGGRMNAEPVVSPVVQKAPSVQSVPGIDETREPYWGPITADMCIEVYWAEPRPDGKTWYLMNSPMKDETPAALDKLRMDGEITLVKCENSAS